MPVFPRQPVQAANELLRKWLLSQIAIRMGGPIINQKYTLFCEMS